MIEFIVALLILAVLSSMFILLLRISRSLSRELLLVFVVATLVHLGAALFIHYANFYPFGGGEGDQPLYHKAAMSIAEDFRSGVFSAERIENILFFHTLSNWYSVVIGGLYAATISSLLVGKMLSVWFAAVAITVLSLIVIELGGSKKSAVLVGLMGTVYPSFLYFGSMLLKESIVAAAALLAFLFLLKLIKKFSWENMLLVFIFLSALIHLRLYVGILLLLITAVSIIAFFQMEWSRKLREGVAIIFLLGFLPMALGHGYYGQEAVAEYLTPGKIKSYRETAYVARPVPTPVLSLSEEPPAEKEGPGSTVVVPSSDNPLKFMWYNLVSFSYVTLGPLPWHLKYSRHFLALLETIPWIILLLVALYGAFR